MNCSGFNMDVSALGLLQTWNLLTGKKVKDKKAKNPSRFTKLQVFILIVKM